MIEVNLELESLIRVSEKLIERSDRYIKDAKERNDQSDVFHYAGQKKAFEEIKEIIIERL